MKVIVDAMGGDNAPFEIVKGAIDAYNEYGVEVVLVGRKDDISAVVTKLGLTALPKGISVVHANEVILMEDHPSSVIKEKPESSMVVGLKMLADGAGDAMVSAGSTGALLSGSTLFVKRIKGIRRAALSPFLPTKDGSALLLDCGANVECTPEFLLQFACMGSFYTTLLMGIQKPKVGLLNVGTEETKGTALQKEAYVLLKKAHSEGIINFVGNIEGRDASSGAVDVIVTDGYSGNILLKTTEGVGLLFISMLKEMFMSSMGTKVAALLMKSQLKIFKKKMDYAETGGTPLLGLSKPVIKAHGSSNAKAMKNAIRQAKQFYEAKVIAEIEKNIDSLKVETTPEA